LEPSVVEIEQLTAATIAERLGYGSEAAFGRAYKRMVGTPPGRVRRTSDVSAAHLSVDA
jgi:AraC-like DNA-binding protein